MNRRKLLRRTVALGVGITAGCLGDPLPTGPDGGDGQTRDGCDAETAAGPGSLYDSLQLHRFPDYVAEYSESVVVRYDALGTAASEAVQQALAADGAYEECIRGQEQTSIKALFAHIERRWEAVGREAFEHTYLRYRGDYYGITLVQEGDFVRVKSIPCTADGCPTTPTPPA